MSYWPEMQSQYCGGMRDLVADRSVQEVTVEWSVIAERKSQYYESCFWRVTGQEGTLKITILSALRGSFSVYSGHSRSKTTAISPPYNVPISSGALIFFQSNQTQFGTGRFSIQVS